MATRHERFEVKTSDEEWRRILTPEQLWGGGGMAPSGKRFVVSAPCIHQVGSCDHPELVPEFRRP